MKQKQVQLILLLIFPLIFACNRNNQSKPADVSIPIDSTDTVDTAVATVDSITIDDGRTILTVWSCDGNWKKIGKVEEKTISEKGKVLRWQQYAKDSKVLTDNYSYVYAGDRIIKEYRWSGKHMTYKVFSYDNLGRLIAEKCYEDDELTKTVKYIYPSKSAMNPIKQEDFYVADKEPGITTEYTYDQAGMLIKEEQFDSGGLYESDNYTRDNDGRLINKSMYVSGQDGGVQYNYIYVGDLLVKDSVVIFDSPTEYHIYERIEINI